VFLNKCKLKHVDITSHGINPRFRGYEDFNLCIYSRPLYFCGVKWCRDLGRTEINWESRIWQKDTQRQTNRHANRKILMTIINGRNFYKLPSFSLFKYHFKVQPKNIKAIVNFTNIIRSAFVLEFFRQKNTKPHCM